MSAFAHTQPIGIFDSGVGGLSVLHHIHQLLPQEDIIYVADSGYAPYGCKDEAFIEQRSRVITEYLIAQGAKAIVIACNTATASIIERFRQQYGLPFIGVEPGIKPAISHTHNGNIGIMATSGTLASSRYYELSQRFDKRVNLFNQACPGLADKVEAGLLNEPKTIHLLEHYLKLLIDKQVDTIVLGCTHYSFLHTPIRQILGESIYIIDTSRAIAEQLKRVLLLENIINSKKKGAIQPQGVVQFFSSGSIEASKKIIQHLLAYDVQVKPLP